MALRSSRPNTIPTAPIPEPDHHHHMETPTHEEVEKGGGGDCHSHHSFSSPSPSPSISLSPMCVWNAIPEEREEDGWGALASQSRPRNNMSHRDPRKAELFQRLDASSEAACLQEVELLHPPLPPSRPETVGSDMFVWPPNTTSWRRFCYLRSATESSPGNHVLRPAQDTSPHYPSKKIQKTVSADKDDKQCYDSEHSSRSMPKEIVIYENDIGENHCSPAPSTKRGLAIGAYVVQCNECQKWRLIPSKKYEELREKTVHIHFTCQQTNKWKLGVTCDDPTDISRDDGGIWAIDKPGIPQPPPGWERIITIRSERSTKFADVYLEQNPQYAAGVQLSQFSFKIPAPLQQDYVRKRVPQSKALQPERVLPLASAPPIHEDNVHNMLMTDKEADPAPDMPQDQLLGASNQTSN